MSNLYLYAFIIGIIALLGLSWRGISGGTTSSMSPSSWMLFMLLSFGVVVSVFVYILSYTSDRSYYIMIYVCMAIVFLSILSKLYGFGGSESKTGTRSSPVSALFYVPNLLNTFIESLYKDYQTTPTPIHTLLLLEGVLLGFYFMYPYLKKQIVVHDGNVLQKDPVYVNQRTDLANYRVLTKSLGEGSQNYNYAISLWVYINPQMPSSVNESNTYNTLFTFGNKPAISYHPQKNILRITTETRTKTDTAEDTEIYRVQPFLLQKWNHFVFNYSGESGGALDVFVNGDLAKSYPGVLSYNQYDQVTLGGNNALDGGICCVVYYNRTISYNEVQTLYTVGSQSTPPSL